MTKPMPTPEIIVETMSSMTSPMSASALCAKLETAGFDRGRSQLAIQRAVESRVIQINRNWSLQLPEPVAD